VDVPWFYWGSADAAWFVVCDDLSELFTCVGHIVILQGFCRTTTVLLGVWW